jgi:hypothetical protein
MISLETPRPALFDAASNNALLVGVASLELALFGRVGLPGGVHFA